jgi:hypothetical protein
MLHAHRCWAQVQQLAKAPLSEAPAPQETKPTEQSIATQTLTVLLYLEHCTAIQMEMISVMPWRLPIAEIPERPNQNVSQTPLAKNVLRANSDALTMVAF